jgi:hypothetical protein
MDTRDEIDDPAVRGALRDLAARYASAMDRRDGEAVRSVFTTDAQLVVVTGGVVRSRREGIDKLVTVPPLLAVYDITSHVLGQSLFEIDLDAGTATGEVYCIAHHVNRNRQGGTDHVMFIRYDDRYRSEPEGWRIAERVVQVDWTETRTVDPLPPEATP